MDWRQTFWDRSHPGQRRVWQAIRSGSAKVVCYLGGIGSGKTAVGSAIAYDLASRLAPGRFAGIVVPSYQTFRQVTLPEIRKWWPPEGVAWRFRAAPGDEALIVYTSNGNSEIQVRSAEDARTLEKIRGPTWAWFWGDEIGTWSLFDMGFNLAIGRLRADLEGMPLRHPVAFLTGSPRWNIARTLGCEGRLPPEAWSAGFFSQGSSPDDAIFISATKTEDNKNNPSGYAEFLRLQYGEAFARQELDGDFVPPAQAVFPGFYRSIHVVPDVVADRLFSCTIRRAAGVDWGFSAPGALVVGGFDSDARLVIPSGGVWSESGKGPTEMAKVARSMAERFGVGGQLTWYVPPDDPEAVAAWEGRLKDRPSVPGTQKARNARENGWESIRNLMRCSTSVRHPADGDVPDSARRPGSWIYIAESNRGLIDDIQGLQYRPVRPGEEPPEDDVVGSDHRPDALRYLVYSALYGVQPKGQRSSR